MWCTVLVLKFKGFADCIPGIKISFAASSEIITVSGLVSKLVSAGNPSKVKILSISGSAKHSFFSSSFLIV